MKLPELDSKTYKIVFKNAAAKTNSTLGAVSLTSANKYDDINDTNTVDASISGQEDHREGCLQSVECPESPEDCLCSYYSSRGSYPVLC